MARSWLVACAWLVGCGDNLPMPIDRTVEAADVSILYPLPETIDQLIAPGEQGAFGTLFPERLFPTAIGPVEIGTGYGDMRMIALRLDPCSARKACNSEVRAIFQPVILDAAGKPTTGNGAIHVFYAVPDAELVSLLTEILSLKERYGAGIAYGDQLGPQPILVATGLDGDFARGLHALILDHLGETRIERFTERNHQIPARDRWDFYLFDGPDLSRHLIATTTADEQQVTGTAEDPASAGGVAMVSPVLDSPLIALVDENRPPDATDAIRAGFARAIELQDPTRQTSESVDCVSCHLAEGGRRIGTTEYGLTPTGAFDSERSLAYQRDIGAVTDLHMFAYDGRYVSVTQRVANESAVVADAMEARLAGLP
jgi:hypothetical protein